MDHIDKILFHSAEGQNLLEESKAYQTLLIRLFKKQDNNTFCGIHSSALLMSAQHFGTHCPDPVSQKSHALNSPPYVEGNMFSFAETRAAVNETQVDTDGCTLEQVFDLFQQHKMAVQMYRADAVSLDEFRAMASKALSFQDSSRGVIVNYDECVLQQDLTVYGHFSPIAAYHSTTDRFLLLDTWHNTLDVWVKAEDLYTAMKTVDTDSNMYRGFIILEPSK